MAGNTFDVGKQASIVYIGPFGRVDFSHITMFDSKPVIKSVKVDPLNSPPIQRDLPGGWDFSFTIERNGPALDALQSLKENAYWTGITLPSESMYVYVTESDGSVSTFQFQNCTSHLEDAGSWSAEKAVQMKVKGFASQRKMV